MSSSWLAVWLACVGVEGTIVVVKLSLKISSLSSGNCGAILEVAEVSWKSQARFEERGI